MHHVASAHKKSRMAQTAKRLKTTILKYQAAINKAIFLNLGCVCLIFNISSQVF